MKKIVVALICVMGLAACSTTRVGLKYESAAVRTPVAADRAARPVEVGSFIDQRGEPANWLGAIRGGFGNPVKKVESEKPVSELVQTAFSEGLRARGVSPERTSAPFQISGVIRKLDCNQMARREANVEIEVSVIEHSSGVRRFSQTYSASNIDGSLLSLKTGVFASVEDLRALTQKTLNDVVDKALDDRALRAALQLE